MSAPLIVLGAGGHASVVIDAARRCGRTVGGLVDRDPAKRGTMVLGVTVLGDDDWLLARDPTGVELVSGLGSVRATPLRQALYERYTARGFRFATFVHPSAVVATAVELADGVQVMAGAVLQPGCRVGADSIVNTRASIDHDCALGRHVHVAPGVVLSGDVSIGDGTHVGVGAVVVQGVSIGRGCTVAAGAVVVADVADGSTVMGVPARRREA